MADPTGTLGAKLYMASIPLTNGGTAADAIGDFQGLSYDLEIGLIENFGEHGRQFDLVTFQAVADGRTRKLKGAYNDGQMQISLGQDLSDAAQLALKAAAEASNQNIYAFKITLVGAPAAYDTIYFGGKPMSFRTNLGGVSNAIKAMVNIEVDTTIFTGAS